MHSSIVCGGAALAAGDFRPFICCRSGVEREVKNSTPMGSWDEFLPSSSPPQSERAATTPNKVGEEGRKVILEPFQGTHG